MQSPSPGAAVRHKRKRQKVCVSGWGVAHTQDGLTFESGVGPFICQGQEETEGLLVEASGHFFFLLRNLIPWTGA